MMRQKKFGRGSGVLCHITSLPSIFGIGDIGPQAHRFIALLAEADQCCWQFLPVGPCSRGLDMSPYMGLSAFAGNPMLISPELLIKDGFLRPGDIEGFPDCSEYTVEFDKVVPAKRRLLRLAFSRTRPRLGGMEDFREFCRREEAWLEPYGLYMGLRERFQGLAWNRWPQALALADPREMARLRGEMAEELQYYRFEQFCFDSQWRRLRAYAARKGVLLIGDLPVYVSYDCADVWTGRSCFRLDGATLLPTHVAGVPPDYFSATGQRWGNPLYRWQGGDGETERDLFAWWARRLRRNFDLADVVRIDHFRGFESYWEIPADEPTAVGGRWVPGPGMRFFAAMAEAIGDHPIIAEDLGVITPEVERLRDDLGFPGMKILQFAFDSDERNSYLPCNYATSNCVVYSGTHDNDTAVGWYLDHGVEERSKHRLRRYANSPGSEIHWDFIRLAMSSVADLAIFPVQDVLGFGSDCRMNVPGTARGNWRWRCAPRFLYSDAFLRLRDETNYYNRRPRPEGEGKQ
ncbi:MAG: 4-alpha-glucanotransferase [Thermodesulfobacteriota bacterium]